MIPGEALSLLTQQLLGSKGRPLYAAVMGCGVTDAGLAACQPYRDALDALLPGQGLQGRRGTHTQWCEETVFPSTLYALNGWSLRGLLADKRFHSERTYAAKDSWHSVFAYMAQPRPGTLVPDGWLDYMLRRWALARNRPMPHFYFDVSDPAWVFEELSKKPSMPRSWRTSTACLMAWSFRWESKTDTLHGTMIMRSMQWSHAWGEFYGGTATVLALMRELDVAHGVLEVFSPSVSLDKPAIARKWMEAIQ